jgi:hypothetical protein
MVGGSRSGYKHFRVTPWQWAKDLCTRLTPEGRAQLLRELKTWNRLSSAVGLLIQNA